jgi:hypothetical protein
MIKQYKTDTMIENTVNGGISVCGVLFKNNKIDYAGIPIGTVASTVAAGDDVIASAVAAGASGLMTGADKTKLDGITAGANFYVHPNHSGDVTSAGDGAATISDHAVTLAKMADMATNSLIGRTSAGTGIPEIIPISTVATMLGSTIGTWTPSIYATTTNPTLTYTSRTGNYTIIMGSMVFINIYIAVNTITTAGSGSIRINLPAGLIPLYNTVWSFVYGNYDRMNGASQMAAQINTAGYIYILECVDNNAITNSAVTRIRNGSILHITGLYTI